MPAIPLYNMQGQDLGTLSLSDSVFGVEPNPALVHQAVVTEEANARQGTAATKTRGEVRGGGRKPWRQKGTGRARQGSIRAPHWYHGGVVFGPHPRSYRKALPKKMRRGALRSALASRVAENEVIGLDVMAVASIKTKVVAEVIDRLPLKREVKTKHFNGDERLTGTKLVPHSVLLIVPEYDEALVKSSRNIPYLTVRYAPAFSVRDVVSAGRVVLTQGALPVIEEVLGR